MHVERAQTRALVGTGVVPLALKTPFRELLISYCSVGSGAMSTPPAACPASAAPQEHGVIARAPLKRTRGKPCPSKGLEVFLGLLLGCAKAFGALGFISF